VVTGIAPAVLEKTDPAMLDALMGAVNEQRKEEAEAWTMERELLAVIAEILHGLLQTTLRVHGAKDVGPPLRIPRPFEDEVDTRPAAVSFGQFASDLKRR
jgi:hypothetical protein